MKITYLLLKITFIIAFLWTSIDCKNQEEITVSDYLNAISIDDLLKKNPNLNKNPSFKHFRIISVHKQIVNYMMTEDLDRLSIFFDNVVNIEIGEIFYKKLKITREELKKFKNKESLLYKFIFRDDEALKALPQVTSTGTKFHSVKYYLQNGSLRFTSAAGLRFSIDGVIPHSLGIQTDCTATRCVITGFSTGGY